MPLNRCRTAVAVLFMALPTLAAAEPPSAQDLIERHRRERSPVWTDGDTATFFYRGQADQVDVLFGADVRPLSRAADSGVWPSTVQPPALHRAFFSSRSPPTAKEHPAENPPAEPAVWRGPKAPPAATESAELKGSLEQFEVESKALGGQRKVTVYRPAGH